MRYDKVRDKFKEECGIIGILSKDKKDISKSIYYGLYALQHRGQESAGIAVNNNGFIDYYKDLGLVHEVFHEDILNKLIGNIAIGHVRYSTSGDNSANNAQPLVIGCKKGAVALAHNGSLINSEELRKKLEDDGAVFQTTSDTEVIANLVARCNKDNIEEAIIKALNIVKGSFALVFITNDKLIGVRDPYGIRPLCIGKMEDNYVICSESCALDSIGAEFIRDVKPGEMVVIDKNGIRSILNSRRYDKKLCIFELIYFARPDSKIDKNSIYSFRKESGKILAQESPQDADIVISAPDSGTVAAIGYAEASKIPYSEGLIKNKYIGRTFIQPNQKLREQGVRIKLNVLKENVEGKRVILVDDSIVRGTTMKRIVRLLKSAGAKEVHVRICSPPVKYPCYFGINTPQRKNLIGSNNTVDEIKEIIGADSLSYLSLEGMIKAAENEMGFCTGCFDKKYPMEVPMA